MLRVLETEANLSCDAIGSVILACIWKICDHVLLGDMILLSELWRSESIQCICWRLKILMDEYIW